MLRETTNPEEKRKIIGDTFMHVSNDVIKVSAHHIFGFLEDLTATLTPQVLWLDCLLPTSQWLRANVKLSQYK